MKAVAKAIVVFLIASVSMAALEPSLRIPDNISGSLGVVKAFQAMQHGQLNTLIETLSSKPSPVNDPLTLKTQNGEIQFLLAHVAPFTRSLDMVGVLAGFGADFETPDSNGRGVMHYASFCAPEVSSLFGYRPFEHGYAAATMISFFSEQGIAADSPDKLWRRPIHCAAQAGDPDAVSALVSLSVDVNAADANGQVPAVLSARRLHFAATEVLKKAGARAHIGLTDYAAGFGNRTKDLVMTYTPPLLIGVAVLLVRPFLNVLFVPLPDHDPDEEEVRRNIPQAPVVSPSGGGRSSVSNAAALTRLPIKEKARAPEAQAEQKKVVTTKSRLETAIKAVNAARSGGNSQEMMAALTAADNLLTELESMKLKKEDLDERGHLVAAIQSIIKKVKAPSIPLRQQANALWEKWKKYHRSESKRR